MITNVSGENSFSNLKLIKNAHRSTMNLMSIENNFLQRLEFTEILNEFVTAKLRKSNF